MDVTFESKRWSLFFDDKRPNHVTFKERGEQPKEYTLDELCEVLKQVAEQRKEWRQEFKN